jgi:hypothetical protein
MTKEERRAEKVRMLVQSGSLFAEAARALVQHQRECGYTVSPEVALQCVFVAEVTRALAGIQHDLTQVKQTAEGRK